jgi:hypothetical protein
MPVLESVAKAEMRVFNKEKELTRPKLLWLHFFFRYILYVFVFGFIKYLVLGKDRSYLYYSLMGLFNALLAISMSEYPPLELSSFENVRGIELFDTVAQVALFMQVLFIVEILQLNTKYPRISRWIKWYFFAGVLLTSIRTIIWFVSRTGIFILIVSISIKFLLFFLWSYGSCTGENKKGFTVYIPGRADCYGEFYFRFCTGL